MQPSPPSTQALVQHFKASTVINHKTENILEAWTRQHILLFPEAAQIAAGPRTPTCAHAHTCIQLLYYPDICSQVPP